MKYYLIQVSCGFGELLFSPDLNLYFEKKDFSEEQFKQQLYQSTKEVQPSLSKKEVEELALSRFKDLYQGLQEVSLPIQNLNVIPYAFYVKKDLIRDFEYYEGDLLNLIENYVGFKAQEEKKKLDLESFVGSYVKIHYHGNWEYGRLIKKRENFLLEQEGGRSFLFTVEHMGEFQKCDYMTLGSSVLELRELNQQLYFCGMISFYGKSCLLYLNYISEQEIGVKKSIPIWLSLLKREEELYQNSLDFAFKEYKEQAQQEIIGPEDFEQRMELFYISVESNKTVEMGYHFHGYHGVEYLTVILNQDIEGLYMNWENKKRN